jgi:uncharacterized protein (DUF433 family)
MTQTETFVAPGISVIAGKRGGRPCVIGTRIEAEMLHGMWKQGYTGRQLKEMYPEVSNHLLWCAVAFWAGVVYARKGG